MRKLVLVTIEIIVSYHKKTFYPQWTSYSYTYYSTPSYFILFIIFYLENYFSMNLVCTILSTLANVFLNIFSMLSSMLNLCVFLKYKKPNKIVNIVWYFLKKLNTIFILISAKNFLSAYSKIRKGEVKACYHVCLLWIIEEFGTFLMPIMKMLHYQINQKHVQECLKFPWWYIYILVRGRRPLF